MKKTDKNINITVFFCLVLFYVYYAKYNNSCVWELKMTASILVLTKINFCKCEVVTGCSVVTY